MKRKIRYGKVQVGAAVLLSSLLLSSCSGAKQTAYNDSAANSVYKEEAELSGVGGEQSGLAKSSGAEAENGERGTSSDYAEGNLQNEIPTNAVEETETNTDMAALSEKKIRTVNISLAVKSVENAAKELKDKVKTQGGYIESEDFSTLNEWDDTKRMSFTIRIPKNNVDGFLEFLDGEGRILSKSENLQDIRLQYRDAKNHIKALETEQDRILALMEKAETVEQLIALESRLTDIRYQLDSYNSEILEYDNKVDFSTIYLELQGTVDDQLNSKPSYSFSDKVRDGFYRNILAIQLFFLNIAVFAVVYIPQIILVLLVIMALLLLNKKLNAKAKKQKEKDAKALKTEDSVKTEASEESKDPISTKEDMKKN
jgi:putative uncharacterized protein (fragment)